MPRTQYRCGVCDALFSTELEIRGHMSGRMETNGGDHPHWDELEVSHHNLEPWKETVPGVMDYD